MLKKQSTSREKKRKHVRPEGQHENRKRRSTDSSVERDSKDELADPELDRIGSDIEEGGLNLGVPFQPISAYVTDRREMLEQCFHVLGEKKLLKMQPDELKGCSLEEIKKLCWEQLEQISQTNLIQILGGEELTCGNDANAEVTLESQQDNIVDSTSSLKESAKTEDPKQEAGGSGEESDVLSINADTYDSDIEGPKEQQQQQQTAKPAEGAVTVVGVTSEESTGPAAKPDPAPAQSPVDSPPMEAKKDIQNDIDKSVSEILAFSSTSSKEETKEQRVASQSTAAGLPVPGGPASGLAPAVCQPSVQQLELLELEMRARAIKALMKASDGKKPCGEKKV